MQKLLILALDGLLDSSLAITLDTLRTARSLRERAGSRRDVDCKVASWRRTVRTAGGLRLDADFTFAELLNGVFRAEWAIVPGLGVLSGPAIESRLRQRDARAAMEVLQRPGIAKRAAASCTSVFLLAEAGLLAGRSATTTWWLARAFRELHPYVSLDESRIVVRDGPCLTAGSAFAQLDLILAIITATMGAEVAHLCSRYMLIDRRASQARYMIPSHLQQVDETVLAAERWIDANLAHPIRVTDLASAVAVSPKTLSRRIGAATGLSPVHLVQRRRVLEAMHLLETTTMSVEAVAANVGYQDSTALRKIIRREFGTTPSALRS